MDAMYLSNIVALNNYTDKLRVNNTVDYCGISSSDDFKNYENTISFKYKIVNPKYQLGKMCDFITDNIDSLDYDWYIKTRPEIKLLEDIDFDMLSPTSINARARVYRGPKKIKYGSSTGGAGYWSHVNDCKYSATESGIILDDQIYIFNRAILNKWRKITQGPRENEWVHTPYWRSNAIGLNVIGLNVEFTIKESRGFAMSGDI